MIESRPMISMLWQTLRCLLERLVCRWSLLVHADLYMKHRILKNHERIARNFLHDTRTSQTLNSLKLPLPPPTHTHNTHTTQTYNTHTRTPRTRARASVDTGAQCHLRGARNNTTPLPHTKHMRTRMPPWAQRFPSTFSS
jgi:hypothetical protein